MLDIRYEHGFDISHDSDYNCDEAGCNDEGICRCGVIRNVTAKIDNAYKAFGVLCKTEHLEASKLNYSFLTKLMDTRIPVEQFFNDVIHTQDFYLELDYEISGGYYGEELGYIYLDNEIYLLDEFNKALFNVFKRYPSENIETDVNEQNSFVLDLIRISLTLSNKGIVIPELEKVNKFYLHNMNLKQILRNILIPNPSHMKRILEDDPRDVYVFNNVIRTKNPYIVGILLKDGKELKLIDGYHRYLAIVLCGLTRTVSYLVLEV